MPLLFVVTLLLSATLLFMVQPMVGKMILPLLGGSPAVWNACMVFFQACLLLGYMYAHIISTRLEPKKQWVVHMFVLLSAMAVMGIAVAIGEKHTPIAIIESFAPSGDRSALLSVMALLIVAIGVPFFVVSTSAPLLQKWFAFTGHPSARDPYFLYAASNAGSLISLLGYPLFVEPNVLIPNQTWIWAIGFVLLSAVVFLCGQAAANPIGVPPQTAKLPTPGKTTVGAIREPAPSARRVGKWIMLAFVPSSLMLGVTFHITTDIASIPLLWVVPLALYLITFIIAFSTAIPQWFRLVIGNLAPVAILLLTFIQFSGVLGNRTGVILAAHIGTFFTVALMCHYELAIDRPRDITHLTAFFLWMSVGGVLGGLFNALIAPLVFPLAYEYPIALVVGCMMVPRLVTEAVKKKESLPAGSGKNPNTNDYESPEIVPKWLPGIVPDWSRSYWKWLPARFLDIAMPATLAFVFWMLSVKLPTEEFFSIALGRVATITTIKQEFITMMLLYAIPVIACFFFVDRPIRFGLCVAGLLIINTYHEQDGLVVYSERSFFGILKVEKSGRFNRLLHGTTLHGQQYNSNALHPFADNIMIFGSLGPWDVASLSGALTAWDRRQEPLTYYHRTGPVGAMFYQLRTRNGGADAKGDVAMVGLGTGSVSCYALPGQRLTFYEIDPAVKHLVVDTEEYFTYVNDALHRGATVDFRMGDARLKLKEDTDRKYALLLVDAFSSDAIPVHLLTEQAVEMYMERLTANGILALHISNKYVRLEPVAAKIVEKLGLAARVWNDNNDTEHGKTASSWIVIAKDDKTLGILGASPTEQALAFSVGNFALNQLLSRFGPDYPANKAMMEVYGADFLKTEGEGEQKKETGLALDEFRKVHGPYAAILVNYVRRYDSDSKQPMTIADLNRRLNGDLFRPLNLIPDVRLWTDDFTDVLQVMMLKEVQWLRHQFGMSTPGLDD